MTSINLYQDSSRQGGEKKESAISGGLVISLGLFVVTLLVWGGLSIYSGVVAKQNTAIAAQIQKEKAAISGNSELDRITDFQKRIDAISADIGSKEYVKNVLGNVSADMVSGTTLTDFSEKEGAVSLVMNVDSFQTVAKQILNFKQSDHFTNVSVTNISKSDSGISLSLEMTSKK